MLSVPVLGSELSILESLRASEICACSSLVSSSLLCSFWLIHVFLKYSCCSRSCRMTITTEICSRVSNRRRLKCNILRLTACSERNTSRSSYSATFSITRRPLETVRNMSIIPFRIKCNLSNSSRPTSSEPLQNLPRPIRSEDSIFLQFLKSLISFSDH